MGSTTNTPSAELQKLEQKREKAYGSLQDVKRKRDSWDSQLPRMRAEATERRHSHPEEHAGAQKIPRDGTEAARLAQRIKERQAAENPHRDAFDKALAKFHDADRACVKFRRERILDLFGESDPDFAQAEQDMSHGWALVEHGAERYQGLVDRALALAHDTEGLNGQSVAWDPHPNDWRRQAREAQTSELAKPWPTPYALHKVQNVG
jgi:hypothetical protein